MSHSEYLDFRAYAKGLFSQAVNLLTPGKCDDFSVISGSILLIVALEKLIKCILHQRNPLITLYEKPSFEDIVAQESGHLFENRNTISFETALTRIIFLYPELASFQKDIKAIIADRNLLVHNHGYLNIGRLERNVQVRVAEFSEALCNECLRESPESILGEKAWAILQANREAYQTAESLELTQRIIHLKRLRSQGQPLPCQQIKIDSDQEVLEMKCPVCSQQASIAFDIDWDIDVDHREGVILGAYPDASPAALACACGFSLSTYDEVRCLLGEDEKKMRDSVIASLLRTDK